jgi:hypothetical protein
MFEYIARPNPDGQNKEGGGTEVAKDGTVRIWIFSGLDASLVHETRHGAGYENREWGWDQEKGEPTYYDYQDEFEAFQQMSDYSTIIYRTGGRSEKAIIEYINNSYSNKSYIIKEFQQFKVPK